VVVVVLLQEILRVLKAGQYFAGYEWCATDLYDPSNPNHKAIMAEIELGNGLPDVRCVHGSYSRLVLAASCGLLFDRP
jgi:hypothetical protein